MNYKQPKQGFTLIELLVVVLIIGILAAVALPQYQKAVTKSRAAQVDVSFNIAKKNIETYILANGWPTEYVFFSGTNNAGDLEMPGDCSTAGACITSVGTFTSTCIPNNYCQVAFSSPINMKDWVGITLAYNSKVGGWFVLLLQSGNAKATCEWIEAHPEYKIYSPEKAKCTSSGVTLSNQVVSSWW